MLDKKLSIGKVVRFLLKLKKTAFETFSFLCEAYGEGAVSRAYVFQWRKVFRTKRGYGRPWTT
jgi:hypothetical protein